MQSFPICPPTVGKSKGYIDPRCISLPPAQKKSYSVGFLVWVLVFIFSLFFIERLSK